MGPRSAPRKSWDSPNLPRLPAKSWVAKPTAARNTWHDPRTGIDDDATPKTRLAAAMPHDIPLILTIVVGLGLAFILGTIAHRLKAPPLIGYLIAGVLVGPHTPGFVADASLAQQLAELGVILLMFGVGLHFSLKDLLSVKAIAIPGAIAHQLIVAIPNAFEAGQIIRAGRDANAGCRSSPAPIPRMRPSISASTAPTPSSSPNARWRRGFSARCCLSPPRGRCES